jgi:PAS domain S-box-containing protein
MHLTSKATHLSNVLRKRIEDVWKNQIETGLKKNIRNSLAERQLRTIEDCSEDAIVGITNRGRVTSWNAAARRIFGHTAQEAIGSSCLDSLSLDDDERKTVSQILARVMKGQTVSRFETTRRHKDGRKIDICVTVAPVRNSHGRVVSGTLIIRDITHQRWADDSLKAHAERIFDLYNNAPCGYHSLDKNGVFVEINDTELEWLGYKRSEVIGKLRIENILPPDELIRFKKAFVTLREKGNIHGYEAQILRKDGSLLPVVVNSSLVKDANGNFIMTRATLHDLTERYAQERKLKAAYADLEIRVKERTKEQENTLALLRSTLDSTADGILVVDNDGKIVTFNRRFLEMWRIPETTMMFLDDERALKLVLNQLKYPEKFLQKVQDVYSNIEKSSHDILEFKDERVFERYSFPHRLGQNVIGRVWSFRDITAFKLAERQLQENMARLTHINSELEQFASVVSHDLKAPLTSIAGYAQLLERHYGKLLDEKGLYKLRFIISRVFKMNELIENLTSYGMVAMQRKNFKKCEIKSILQQALSNLAISISDSGAEIEQSDLPEIRCDGTQILQLLQNLIGNAIKYKGTERPRISIQAQEMPDEWLFSIRDNGCGIPADALDTVFVMFQRALNSKTERPGSGIGLAICKKIVEHHGGKIWVESQVGHGSCFYFTLPR